MIQFAERNGGRFRGWWRGEPQISLGMNVISLIEYKVAGRTYFFFTRCYQRLHSCVGLINDDIQNKLTVVSAQFRMRQSGEYLTKRHIITLAKIT